MILGPEFRLQSCLDAISDSAFGALELEGSGFIDWRVWGARTLVKPQNLNPQTANPAVGERDLQIERLVLLSLLSFSVNTTSQRPWAI